MRSLQPEKCIKSEWFAGFSRHVWAICLFFSLCLSTFAQTWCAFQAHKSCVIALAYCVTCPSFSRAWFLQRICNFCLKLQKNLWICLILQKNRWRKYRFFALFRRMQQKVGACGEKPVRSGRIRWAWSAMRSDVAGECRSPKAISVSVDLLHKIFITRKDELVKDLPAT